MTAKGMPRRLGLLGAVGIGFGSMLGAGVFVVWGPAAAYAGSWLPLALAIAAVVAAMNAASTAALASRHPVAGGAYAYGARELAGPWGFLAGIGFVVGKTASVAAMALAIGSYAWPGHPEVVASAAIAIAWLLNAGGVVRTAGATGALAAAVAIVVVGASIAALLREPTPGVVTEPSTVTLRDIVAAAGLLFFAFAGYARLATLGEEVRRPRRTIPLAIGVAFAAVLAIYALVAAALWRGLGFAEVAGSLTPLSDAAGDAWLAPLAGAAALAAGGSMVALLAGLGRTAMAMARNRDMPGVLARQRGNGVPVLPEAVVGLIAVALVWSVPLGRILEVSSVAVLGYYAVAHAAAIAARRRDRTFPAPMPMAAIGLASCLALASALSPWAMLAALAAWTLALAIRSIARRGGSGRAGRRPAP